MKNKLLVIIPIVLFVTLVIILGSVYILQNKSKGKEISQESKTQENNEIDKNENSPEGIIWSFNGTNWVNIDAKPSNCPSSLTIKSPVDLSNVTSIMYPGQIRGGNYKAHGGFRFDNNPNNKIEVRMPLEGYIFSASSYIESGERQYMVDFINNCGYMVRFDHLSKLSPEVQSLFKSEIPDNGVNDSRSTKFKTLKLFKTGDLIASEVGFKAPKNVGVDFGLYDFNSTNEASKKDDWYNKYKMFAGQIFYGVCWLDNLEAQDKAKAYSLPGSGTEGKVSDYCN